MPRLKLKVMSLLALAAFLPACSSEFNKSWNTEEPAVVADASQTIAGKWEGQWYANAHDYFNGVCRAVITEESTSKNLPTDPPGRRFRVEIQQVYTNVIPRDYAFALFMTPGPEGKVWLRGEHDFGAYADGLYKFEGDATGRTIYLSFTAVNDYGTIVLRRWPPAKA